MNTLKKAGALLAVAAGVYVGLVVVTCLAAILEAVTDEIDLTKLDFDEWEMEAQHGPFPDSVRRMSHPD